MAHSLRDIIEVAAQTFPDHYLQRQYHRLAPNNVDELTLSETLAAYLVKEFTDLYSPESSDQANLARIISSLQRSVHLLEGVVLQLERLEADVA